MTSAALGQNSTHYGHTCQQIYDSRTFPNLPERSGTIKSLILKGKKGQIPALPHFFHIGSQKPVLDIILIVAATIYSHSCSGYIAAS